MQKNLVNQLNLQSYAVNFISNCYDARSKLVHSGKVDETQYNIDKLAANLEVYLKDMLTAILEI